MVKKHISSYSYKKNGKKVVVKAHTREYNISPRSIHQKRPYKIRRKDEKTTEPFTSPEKWSNNPNKYDYPCVDSALNDNYYLDLDKTDRNTWNMYVYEKYTGDDVANAILELDGKNAWFKAMLVNYHHRGNGLSNVLLRNVTNYADKNKITVRLKVQPFDEYYDSEIDEYLSIHPTKENIPPLAKYYEQFGFVKQGGIKEDAKGHLTQFMIREVK